ncbi:50S ribosomal protein L5 [Candidatus Collierbacteria bacterium RIFCSPLOWO2_01_FULL_50_23]|uniref:Large ribosomal subunit protein uL5 n=1 Tax=Candidatus Collierbacteria bacterium RIFCSPHIGHO2_01_FULL_50_25 TaxID=1817722 RepID=A0A1F5EW93_9BACT|nr:ribosomal protein L5 [uncultured bacterium]OGD71657.1 MAG: 50S ribosomal protein L5 [Candidatus Collierbacteria bacterium RIFCSPHIGHO2_01_FULL_50_25]OGD73970.1 MAG: 50S ribosomal protein L5 [Candidatus Collierbacteria bacterium RIFCSPLOWO2_01_FULL_50_23]
MAQELKQLYLTKVREQLKDELKLKNVNAVPKLVKITLNTSSRDFKTDREFLTKTKSWLSTVTGQMPVETKSKQSIAAFNLRAGEVVGLKVTLRGDRAYDFLQKMINIILPRFRDFQGVSKTSFDKAGNFTIGLKEQIVFPEVEYDKIGRIQGLEITITTSASDRDTAFAYLKAMGMPFVKE